MARTCLQHGQPVPEGYSTVGTGLIVKGLAKPKMKVELDIDAVILETGSHTKIRTFDTGDWFG